MKDTWTTGMPWQAVNAALDTSFNYDVPESGKEEFVTKTGHAWNNAEDPLTKTLHCPRCSQKLDIPWTTCGQKEKISAEDIMEMNGSGYGDRNLDHVCYKCGGTVNHNILLVAKFKKDTENLIMNDWPLGGTILDSTVGAPHGPPARDWQSYPHTFPNRLVGSHLRSSILELITPTNSPTMDSVKTLIEWAIIDKAVIRKVNNKTAVQPANLQRAERLAIRKMMSRYWENRSIFALDLGGAVIRQGAFVDKMHSLDWLHSPSARNTMNRLLTKYSRFITIIAHNPLNTAVPTLDVDLGWHTHQLSPNSYFTYTGKTCKKYIDHDDKIDEEALSTAFEWTSKTYEKLYQEVYSECTCWYCESIRVKHISSVGKIFGVSKHEKVLNNFYDSGAAKMCPPDNSAHISAHNAVRVTDTATRSLVNQRLRKRKELEMEAAYKKACKRAQAKGRPPPPRQDYYYGKLYAKKIYRRQR
jgi:hypothetical protein